MPECAASWLCGLDQITHSLSFSRPIGKMAHRGAKRICAHKERALDVWGLRVGQVIGGGRSGRDLGETIAGLSIGALGRERPP